ncbi:SDR family oxidoreductase [Crocinitomix algicola]|uniref:SDR family oxidoreductase n=1 Tax=Crocinitomix algicola TaxID=1740263 RepID=UPI0008726C0B|nr:SDR family oxidoreductase [Crocinitomix algicola]
MELKDKVYIVTGGSSGLGKAMAEALINEGAKVVITGRDENKLNEVANAISAIPFHADVVKDEEIEALYKFVDEKFDQLDGVINNAGIAGWSEVDALKREDLQKVFDVNVFGAAIVAAHAAKRFKKQNYGDIVNIASTASQKGFKMGSIYAASKFALRGMSQSWQAELRPFNVRVIQINPSEVPTAFNVENRSERTQEPNKLSPKEIADVAIASLKMDSRGFIPEVSVFATNPF